MNALLMASSISLVLSLAKGGAFIVSGSLVVLASFLDSLMDAAVSLVNYKLSKASHVRADRQHPYGHGGLEVIGAVLQSFFIAGSGCIVLYKTVTRLISPEGVEQLKLHEAPLALGIMILSTAVGLGISQLLTRSNSNLKSSQQRSLSIEADKAHYTGDIYQNVLGIAAMAITIWTQNPTYDLVLGGISGLILLATAYPLIKNGIRDIMNTEFDQKLQEQVQEIVLQSGIEEVKGMHRLRSRTLGPKHFVDFHLKLPDNIRLIEAHEIAMEIEAAIKAKIPHSDVMIHLDPEAEPDDDF